MSAWRTCSDSSIALPNSSSAAMLHSSSNVTSSGRQTDTPTDYAALA